MSARARATAAKYQGENAKRYEAERVGQEKWAAEDRILREWLADLPRGASVLDAPVGTGRFIPFWAERGVHLTGLDINRDMFAQAQKVIDDLTAGGKVYSPMDIRLGNVLGIDLDDGSVDVAVCMRLLNLIEPYEMQRALAELQRVSRSMIIFSLRIGSQRRPGRIAKPQKIEDVTAALQLGWGMARNEPIHNERYRMIMLTREKPFHAD